MLDCGRPKIKRRRLGSLFRKMSRQAYSKMEEEGKEKKEQEIEVLAVKKTKKKRSWKRVRAAALSTCRYIGMGAAHMSPASMYVTPDYSVDPRHWNRAYNPNAPHKTTFPPPHWTNTFMFSTY